MKFISCLEERKSILAYKENDDEENDVEDVEVEAESDQDENYYENEEEIED